MGEAVEDQGVTPSGPGSQASPEAASASSPSVSIPNAVSDYEKTAGMRALTGWIDFDASMEEISSSVKRAQVRYANGTVHENWANQFAWKNVCNPRDFRIVAFRVTKWVENSPEGRRDSLARKAMLYRLYAEGEPHAEIFAQNMAPKPVDFAFADLLAASGIEARRAETGTGSVHESPVAESETPKGERP